MKRFIKKTNIIKPEELVPQTQKKANSKAQKVYTLKADLDIDSYDFAPIGNNYVPKVKEIKSVSFTWLSSDEIKNMSYVDITNPKNSTLGGDETKERNSLSDTRMGTSQPKVDCVTCGEKYLECPGHSGHIALPVKFPHPLMMKRICEILTCFCSNCHRSIYNKSQLMGKGIIKKYKNVNRFKSVLELSKKVDVCDHCKEPHGKFSVSADGVFTKKIKKAKFVFKYSEIIFILENINDLEFKMMGFNDPSCHPRNLILDNLYVIPSCARPYIENGGKICPDDLTQKYIEILKGCIKYQNSEKASDKESAADLIYSHIRTMFDNSKNKAKEHNNSRPIVSIKQRISGKGKLVRGHIQGKRNNQSSRTVLSIDPDLHINEVGLPRFIADKLSFPVVVNQMNMNECYSLIENKKVNAIKRDGEYINLGFAVTTMGYELSPGEIILRNDVKIHEYKDNLKIFKNPEWVVKDGDHIIRTKRSSNEEAEMIEKKVLIKNVLSTKPKKDCLKIGDVLERKLQDGDFGIVNRQPSLHELSVRAKKVRIFEDKTLKMELSSTAGYGADFDGDEGNFLPATSLKSKAEMMCLMSTESQFISASNASPALVLKQDTVVSCYLFTKSPDIEISKFDFMDVCTLYPNFKATMNRLDFLKQMHDKHKKGRPFYTGHNIFSMLLPSNFTYNFSDIKIRSGCFLEGTLEKKSLDSLIHNIYKDYGEVFAGNFVTYLQRFMNVLLQRRGFSVGIEDCLHIDSSAEIEKFFALADDKENSEEKVLSLLDRATNVGEDLVRKKIKTQPENSFIAMIVSGAKGSLFNYVNSVAAVGQQNLAIGRSEENQGNRTLPCFLPTTIPTTLLPLEIEPEKKFCSRGFILSSFYKGLKPSELFFMTAAGRESLVHVSISTSKTGYISRKLLKLLEDVSVSYKGPVVNPNGNIYEFIYGDDGFSADQLIRTNKGLQCADVGHIMDCLNAEYEDLN